MFSIIGLDVTGVVIVSGCEHCCLFTLKGCGSSYITLKRDLFLFLLKGVSVMEAVPVKARRERQSPWN